MGQARIRGTLEERIARAKTDGAGDRRPSVSCNACQLPLSKVEAIDTSALAGIGAAYAAHCDACDQDTWAVRGEPKAVKAFYDALEKAAGAKVQLGTAKPASPST